MQILSDAQIHRFHVGSREVVALQDGLLHVPLSVLKPEDDPLRQERFLRELPNPLEWSNNVYLIFLDDRRILIDAGGGDLFAPESGQILAALAASGLRSTDITDVCLTHLHPDHIGGLMLHDQRTFADARLHVNRKELEYWLAADSRTDAPAHHSVFFEALESKFLPYQHAGLVHAFDEGDELFPGLTTRLQPGHTPGLTAFKLTSGGSSLTFIGDLFNEPAQVRFPEMKLIFDWDSTLAAATRTAVLGEMADSASLIAVPHATFPGLDRVVRDGDAYQLIPAEPPRKG